MTLRFSEVKILFQSVIPSVAIACMYNTVIAAMEVTLHYRESDFVLEIVEGAKYLYSWKTGLECRLS